MTGASPNVYEPINYSMLSVRICMLLVFVYLRIIFFNLLLIEIQKLSLADDWCDASSNRREKGIKVLKKQYCTRKIEYRPESQYWPEKSNYHCEHI